MKPDIKLNVNRTSVTEGDIVEVTWNCTNADSAQLTIDNGFNATTGPIELSGSKKLKLVRADGKAKLTVTATNADNKSATCQVSVKVRKIKPLKAEYVDGNGRTISKLSQKWSSFKSKAKFAWGAMSDVKKLAVKVMGLLLLASILTAISPKLYGLGLFIIFGYLLWTLSKRR